MQSYDLVAHLLRQRAFSRATFGPGMRTQGVVDHIRKELVEIEKAPRDITEWVDVVLLALDGLWRCVEAGPYPIEVAVSQIEAKQTKNEGRDWPNWRTADPNKAIEHVRGDAADAMLTAPSPSNCPYVACPSPFVCRGGCKIAAAERTCDDVGGGP